MCLRRQQMPVWLRLNYVALSLLLGSRTMPDQGSWRTAMGSAGAAVLVVAIALMFAERRRGSTGGR
jgi:hypothetical protein